MNAVSKIDEGAKEVATYGGSLLAVIERAARDPNVDIDKMERLLAMQERVNAHNAKLAFLAAKREMRPHLPAIDRNGHIIITDRNDKNKVIQDTPYAKFEDIHFAVMPILTEYGFDLSYRNATAPDGKVRVITILSHSEGHEEETYFDLPHDGSGSKNAVQAIGSSTQYGKRYGTVNILNLRVAGEDDDAKTATYKDTTGEPLARAKLEGPHTSKSALKAEMQRIRHEVNGCYEVAHLNALLKAAKPTIDQANQDWAALVTGDPNIPEDGGLQGDVERRRAWLKENGAMFAGLLKSMRECDTIASLERWRGASEGVIETLDDPELRYFEREYEKQEAANQQLDTVRA